MISKRLIAILALVVTAVIIAWVTGLFSASLNQVSSAKIREIQRNTSRPLLAESGVFRAYRGATLIDGTGRDAVENATVVVNGNKIVAVGPAIDIPENAEIIDVSGRWMTPGLIDAHMHFMTSGRIYTRPAFIDLQHVVSYQEEINFIKQKLATNLRSHTCAGVTGAISFGGPSIEYAARAKARTMADAPTIFISHGVSGNLPEFVAKRFFPLWDGELAINPIRSSQAAVEWVREAAEFDADLIKFAYTKSGTIQTWMQSGFEDIVSAMAEEASRLGMKVTTHTHNLEAATDLIRAGSSSIAHVPASAPVNDEFIELAWKNGIVVIPTIALRERTFENSFNREYELTQAEKMCADPDVIRSWYEVNIEDMPEVTDDRINNVLKGNKFAYDNVKALYDAGVMLAVGTDAGIQGMPLGSSMHSELRAMAFAGIPAGDLIVAATLNAAKVAGQDHLYGSVEAGKFADFLILARNPLADIANLQAIEVVVKHGKAFRQEELLPSQ